MKQKLIVQIAAARLLIGCVLGMIGTVAPSDTIRNILWAIDSCGLVLAVALLTLYFLKKGYDVAGAGFLIFAIAESVVFSSGKSGPCYSDDTQSHGRKSVESITTFTC